MYTCFMLIKHFNTTKMKKIIVCAFVCITLTSCSKISSKKDLDELKSKVDSLQKVTEDQAITIITLRDSISILAFPAEQRLSKIKTLIASEDYYGAKSHINQLKKIFPNSSEAVMCNDLEATIKAKEENKKAELERIKALGFKAITAKSSFTIDYNTMTLSNFSIGSEFIHDAYDNRWFYQTADRGNKFVTVTMSIKSTNKDPKIPEFAVYSVNGDKMKYVGKFQIKYARWRDYGAYLGNYHDTNNDFAKVSTVKFKLGAEVSEAITSKAFAIVCKKENGLSSSYDRFANPPMSWIGSVSYPSTLKVSDFENNYVLIKLYNL